MRHLAFAIEDNVGNTTYRKNLEFFASAIPDIKPIFLPISLVAHDIWALIPGIRSNLALVASARAGSALHAVHGQQKVDAALIHSQSIGLFSLKFMRSVPTIISTDATPANFDTLNEGYGQQARARFIESVKEAWTRFSFRSARVLLAWSDWVKASFINDYGVAPEKVETIPPGLSTELWRPEPTQKKNDGIVRILFTSGDFQRKGGDILVRWIKTTRHQKNVEIHMASKEPIDNIPGVVPHYGLTPNSAGLVQLAQGCDLFALPTRADTWGWAVVEAQAVGLPVVSTRVGAVPELIEDGVTGFIADPNDQTGIFERLDKLVEDAELRQQMGRAARERVIKYFDGRKNAIRLFELMKRIASS